jgi:O-antigen/teichoic acid export membrane protein
MKSVATLLEDELLGRVVRNSAHLFSSNTAGLALSIVQGILAARMLGPAGYGLIAVVMSYTSTINGLLSFRMSELVVRYGGEALERNEKMKAAALLKLSALAEATVSAAAFCVVALTAGAASRFVTKTPGTEWMFAIYAAGLLFSFNAETATGVLQITNQIKVRGTINFIQALCSAAVITAAYIWLRGTSAPATTLLLVVLGAYLVGKALLGMGLFVAAWRAANRALGAGWRSAKFSGLPPVRELLGFGVSSNLSATAILAFRESEVLWVGVLLNSEAAGLYKVAYTIVGLLSIPADPLILSVYPEVNRLVVQRAWGRLKSLLKAVTGLSFLYNAVLAIVFVVLGRWLLSLFGTEFTVAYPAVLTLLAGLVFNYTLFWNRPLLLSLGLQRYALGAIVLAGFLKLALAIPLVPAFGYVMEAALLSGYYLLSVGLIAGRGLHEVERRMVQPEAAAA